MGAQCIDGVCGQGASYQGVADASTCFLDGCARATAPSTTQGEALVRMEGQYD